MGKFWKFIFLFLGFFVLNKYFGILAGAAFIVLVLLFLIWNNRATIMTRIATQAYFIRGEKEKSAKLFEKAYKTEMMTSNSKIYYSSFCLREGRLEKAKHLLTEVINSRYSNDADRISGKHNMAVVLWREGDLAGAIDLMREVHKKATSSGTYGTYGVLLLEKAKETKDFEEIREFMVEAYEYNEDDKTIADNLGEFYYNTGEYDKAKAVYEKLLIKEFVTPMPYYNYGKVLKELGNTEKAKEMFEKALTCRFTNVITVNREMVEDELKKL
ncbi:MAG: tetratricopeptide repeat protein [Clostridia bacterium]|nr:tetratricopeptide repeat protein [Clostridia bacterium]